MSYKIAAREFLRSPRQVLLYLMATIVCFGVFLLVDSVQVSLEQSLASQQKNLVGGDIIVTSNQKFLPELQTALDQVKQATTSVEMYEFSSMVRHEDQAILSSIKIVSDQYPLYGEPELSSQKKLSEQLISGQIIVEPSLLVSLEANIGDEVWLGETALVIVDTLVSLPDQSLSVTGFGGPTILVAGADALELGLLGNKSRISYTQFFKTENPEDQKKYLDQLTPLVQKPANIESAETAQNQVKRITDRFLVFIKLVIICLLLLNVLAMATIILSFLVSQQKIIAIRKSLGESPTSIMWSYHLNFLTWSSIAFVILTIACYFGLQGADHYGADFFAIDIKLHLAWMSLLKTFVLLNGTTVLLTIIGLSPVMKMSPSSLFRFDTLAPRSRALWMAGTLLLGIYGIAIYAEFQSLIATIIFVMAILGIFGFFWGCIKFILWQLKKNISAYPFNLKIILRSLNRPGSSVSLFLSILTLSLTFIFGIILVEQTIQKQFFVGGASDAPNIFLLDIKKDQVPDIKEFFGTEIQFYPVVRGRIESLQNISIQTIAENSRGFGDNITRVFNMTYYDALLDTETIVASTEPDALFGNNTQNPVSILASMAEEQNLSLGDEIIFKIQGIELKTVITSIRGRKSKTEVAPFFYFVFPTEVLSAFPQTLFATTNIESQNFAVIQKDLLGLFPQISVIDTAQIQDQVSILIGQLSALIRWITGLNIFVGFIVLVSSLVASTKNRQEEAAFYRLLGMRSQTVWNIILTEMAFVAGLIILVSLIFSYAGVGIVLSYFFDITVVLFPPIMVAYSLGIFCFILFSAVLILRKPLQLQPIDFIKKL
jgi:putative ABC transport system permease protein